MQGGGDHRGRGIGPHAARVGAQIAVVPGFMVLGAGHGQDLALADQGDEADLFSLQEFLDDDPVARAAKAATGLAVTMEVMTPEHVAKVSGLADILWIGARNMQNYELLKALQSDPRPVILKRAFIATMKEWLGAAEYIGREKVILCERGIRTGADSMRFTLDLNAMLVAQHDHGMPVLVDPSHTAGRRDMVPHLALAAIAAGADGLIIETHYDPEEERVDREQTITIPTFAQIVKDSKNIREITSKG